MRLSGSTTLWHGLAVLSQTTISPLCLVMGGSLSCLEMPASELPALELSWIIGVGVCGQDVCPPEVTAVWD